MAADRFINKCKRLPTVADMQLVLEDFFGEGATEITWSRDRFFITLAGKKTFPFLRIEPDSIPAKAFRAETQEEGFEDGRYMEVWMHEDTVDVLTRRADEYTNSVGAGLARLIARYWQGALEKE